MGASKGGQVNGLKHGWDIAIQGSAGLWVKDSTRLAEYIFDAEV